MSSDIQQKSNEQIADALARIDCTHADARAGAERIRELQQQIQRLGRWEAEAKAARRLLNRKGFSVGFLDLSASNFGPEQSVYAAARAATDSLTQSPTPDQDTPQQGEIGEKANG